MKKSSLFALMVSMLAAAAPAMADAPTLRGSRSSMVRQHEVAQELDYTFLRTPGQVQEFVEEGRLVEIAGNGVYEVARGVSYPFARPELRLFIERLGAQYREECGEALVVTSLTRPISAQPGNAHRLSVHPAGMAVDFRISQTPACREWLETALLQLEEKQLLDVTRERNPPHYHVAVFPEAYMTYAAEQQRLEALSRPVEAEPAAAPTRAAERTAQGADGELLQFAVAVVLSLALVLTMARPQGRSRDPRY